MDSMELEKLLKKYDVPVPRYTSYPTVPSWDHSTMNELIWKEKVKKRFSLENGELSLYIHLPFCENLCTFCACNKRITKNHKVEDPYVNAVLAEWAIYRSFLPGKPVLKELHLGGGTPTFFSPENLQNLLSGITTDCILQIDREFSIEVHPNYTTEKHLETLASFGFKRISVGVQDFDPKVQFAINRIQSFEKTREVVEWARKHGYSSINIDLVYGLPHQAIESIQQSINCIRQLMPDRIAFYSYAHVPWKSKVQRRYSESDLPDAELKLAMYSSGRMQLEAAGFIAIGMDHFALKNDSMFIAAENGSLNRNFMGYTTTTSKLLIGLGTSSISDCWDGFIQNDKTVESYEALIAEGRIPIIAGHALSQEDLAVRKIILDLMCSKPVSLNESRLSIDYKEKVISRLVTFIDEGLILFNDGIVSVTRKGKTFIRNIAASFDTSLFKEGAYNGFSKAI